MTLSAQSSESENPKHQLIERRASVRRLARPGLTGQVTAGQRGRPWNAIIYDVSKTGIGLILNQTVEKGTPLAVVLDSPDASFRYTFETNVMHSTAKRDGAYLVGCAFSRELTDAEFLNLP